MKIATDKRTAAWYFREIKRQVSMSPTRPARFDFMWTKRDTILEKVLDMLLSDDAPQQAVRHEMWWSLQSARFKSEHLNKPFTIPISSWSYSVQEHFDLLRKNQGFMRAAFFGPDYQQPAHFLDVPVRLRGRDLEARFVAVQKQIEALHRKFGADYHIEHIVSDHDMSSKMIHKYGCSIFKRDEHNVPLNVLRVWRGEDWLANKTDAYYPAEIARILPDIIMKVHSLKPDAERGRKNVEGGRRGGLISGANRIAKRGDCIEKHRDEFVRLCKTMKPRSAAIRIAKQSKFHFDAIAYHFRLHPTPPKP